MKIGKRNSRQLFKALFAGRHYIAFLNMLRVYPNFFKAFTMYFWGTGKFPCRIQVRTPIGFVSPQIFSYYDMLTVNEIFCRNDYRVDSNIKVVLDLGSNIGISALYFLTRNSYSKCYLFEPVPENVDRIKNNLEDFSNRYFLQEQAVSNKTGISNFGLEEFGRCGGLSRKTGEYIRVACRNINNVLEEVLTREEAIDVLKIDIEGDEIKVLQSIDKKFFPKTKLIFFEIDCSAPFDDRLLFPDYYHQERCGNIVKLTLKNKIN